MGQKIADVRLTLYAMIIALEKDLRRVLLEEVLPQCSSTASLIKEPLLEKKVIERFRKENPGLNLDNNLASLLDYLDFSDSYRTILTHADNVPQTVVAEVRRVVPVLDVVAPIRNRVMHGRPLMSGDFTKVYSLLSDLHERPGVKWANSMRVIVQIQNDPSFVFSMSLPDDAATDESIMHNLPFPDFDDSGFIGRENDVKKVKELILGRIPVVSVIGDGGIGKSALMLKVAYDVVDMGTECPFDAVIWASAKSTMLTPSGIKEIKGALTDFAGISASVARHVGGPEGGPEQNLAEILEFMECFNVWLILDNMETVVSGTTRDFLRKASEKGKIGITSRIGLGELEYPRKLEGLGEAECIQLIRALAEVRNCGVIQRLSNKQLARISAQLHRNPLALKWFLQSVDAGANPENVLQQKEKLLAYCMSNVYEALPTNARLILQTILSSRRPVNDGELYFLTELEPMQMRQGLNDLFCTTMVSRSIGSRGDMTECCYSISDFAREYLIREHAPSSEFVKKTMVKLKKLRASYEDAQRVTGQSEFQYTSIVIRNPSEAAVARLLQEALRLSRRPKCDFKGALGKIDQARGIAPSYFEVYRVSALIKVTKGDTLGAEADYQIALDIESDNPVLLYFYAGFLLIVFEDPVSALLYAEKAVRLRPNSAPPVILKARCLGYNGRYSEAVKDLEMLLNGTMNTECIDRKKAATLMIDFLRRWQEDDCALKRDFRAACEKLRKAMSIYENMVRRGETDSQMVDEAGEAYLAYLRVGLNMSDEIRSEILRLFRDNAISLVQSREGDYLLEFLAKHYGDQTSKEEWEACLIGSNSIQDKLGGMEKEARYQGIVKRFWPNRSFAFIEAEGLGSLYFNNSGMRRQQDWSHLREEMNVEFSLSANNKGQCAIDVILIDH